MARIGNESRLILKLAEEKAKASKRLQEELRHRSLPGNYPEKYTWQQALETGYRLGISVYQETLRQIASSLENK